MGEIMDTKKPDPVAHAARLLRAFAQGLRETATLPPPHQWTGEDEAMARAAHDEYVAAADALEAWEISVGAPLRTGYDAARMEIESLQTRIQELGQQARECSDRKVVQLESVLARHVRSGKDWAMRVEALERTITTLRAHIASLNAQVAAEKKAMRELDSANSIALQLDARIKELEGQLDAVGAGGVEPLRKRECLHQIAEPDHFRGATQMVTAARQPLDDKAILQGRTDGYDAEDPPEGWAFAQGVRFAERAHGITGAQE